MYYLLHCHFLVLIVIFPNPSLSLSAINDAFIVRRFGLNQGFSKTAVLYLTRDVCVLLARAL